MPAPLTLEEKVKRAVAVTIAEAAAVKRPWFRYRTGSDKPIAVPSDPARAEQGEILSEVLTEHVRAQNGAEHQDEAAAPPKPPSRDPARYPDGGTDNALPLPYIVREGAPVDVWVAVEDGIRRWRPVVDSWRITELPNDGRLLEISGARPLRADAEIAARLAWLFMPEAWRVQLGAVLGEGER